MMKTLGVIPARFGSTRFPGKPLAIIHGKTMIERVYNRASGAKGLTKLVVATDDQRIFDHVLSFGGKVLMTDPSHASGTDRCAEALNKSENDFDFVVNIQGDEPYIQPGQIDQVIDCLNQPAAQIATLVKRVKDLAELENENIPKVVVQNDGQALYFSRHAIPWCKPEEKASLVEEGFFLRHIGIYGYRASVLPVLSKLARGKAEVAESLEQLRWLENGFHIMTAVTEAENHAVDAPGDIGFIESRFKLSD